ncbi:MAG: TrkH family potassium uptake protein [Alphaproteobacteria bacterium]|nr:MAG: TrkH family potassium uptake protein [Alphaproteobacteria bacterium]
MSASPTDDLIARAATLAPAVVLVAVAGLAMFVPGAYGLAVGEGAEARGFLAAGGLTLALASMLALALARGPRRRPAGSYLATLAGAYVLLPLVLAVPFHQAVGTTRFLNAYLEMVSCLTTTGATLFAEPGRLSSTAHLWRALVGWMGGFYALLAAVAVFAPLGIGGFEVLLPERGGRPARKGAITEVAEPAERLRRFALWLAPAYAALTLALWIGLLIAGDRPLVALTHAMSTLSTSGISPVGGASGSTSGAAGEALILFFLVLALTRLSFSRERGTGWGRALRRDPELRLGLALIFTVALALFLRHWWGAMEVQAEAGAGRALHALWGALFTTASFLTTTGFVSEGWGAAQDWSGLHTPGLLLMGLAIFGGGVATTAGGVKLLRLYALWLHGRRELERLVHPSSVAGSGLAPGAVHSRAAYVAWLFFMLFAMSVAVLMLAFSLTGLDFETTLVLTIAGLTTTGPLLTVAEAAPVALARLDDAAKLLFAGTMVLGRLEGLAIVALLSPEIWRR